LKLTLCVVFLLAVLNGCATQDKYKIKVSALVGATEDQLIQKWGEPQGVDKLSNNTKVLTYVSIINIKIPDSKPKFQTAGNVGQEIRMIESIPGLSSALICNTKFQIQDEVVIDWHIQGNDCKSN